MIRVYANYAYTRVKKILKNDRDAHHVWREINRINTVAESHWLESENLINRNKVNKNQRERNIIIYCSRSTHKRAKSFCVNTVCDMVGVKKKNELITRNYRK